MSKPPVAIPDVSSVQCPAREPARLGEPVAGHRVKAGVPGPGRYAENPVWRCWDCGVTWVELDQEIRAARGV